PFLPPLLLLFLGFAAAVSVYRGAASDRQIGPPLQLAAIFIAVTFLCYSARPWTDYQPMFMRRFIVILVPLLFLLAFSGIHFALPLRRRWLVESILALALGYYFLGASLPFFKSLLYAGLAEEFHEI